MVRQVLGEAATPLTHLAEPPGRGSTRVWECAGPRGAETLMLIHGVTFTAELNWGQVFAPLARHFRVVAVDLRGHGDGIGPGSRFRLEDCADDVAALAGVLGIRRFAAVGYSMGGMVAQLLYRRHASLLSGLVLCSTARNVRESPAENLATLALPTALAALRWNPVLHLMSAEISGEDAPGPRGRPGHRPVGPRPAEPDLARLRRVGHPGRLRVPVGRVDRPGRCPGRGGRHDQGSHRAREPSAQAGRGDPWRVRAPGGRRPQRLHQRAAAVRPGPARSVLVGGTQPRPPPPARYAGVSDGAWPVTMNPLPNASSRTSTPSISCSRRFHGRSNPSKLRT